MKQLIIKKPLIITENNSFVGDILIEDDKIIKISKDNINNAQAEVIDAKGLYLFPGAIDDQVHFREPGLTHKADIYSESRAAAAGGVTSFMEMPNTKPQATTIEELERKYELGAEKSMVNYSFFMGTTNDNLDEIKKVNPKTICGVKVFMGSSTGNMLVDNRKTLEGIFAETPTIIATHCEDEATINANTEAYYNKYGESMPFKYHPEIRSAEACYKSSSLAAELATKYNSKLHILHLSTEKELSILSKGDIADKNITGEVCVHHLWFNADDYDTYGSLIKWNPAVKYASDQQALFAALLEDKLDVIATDHAPHTLEEKSNPYFKAPSGGPLIQHSLVAMLEYYKKGLISIEKIAEKMSHAPARLFQIADRGFIKEGYKADLVLVNLNDPWTVSPENIYYKCGWSPFEGTTFSSKVVLTMANGKIVFNKGKFGPAAGERLLFNR